MDVRTLIIGFVPLADIAGVKPRKLKENTYMQELLAEYDFGEVHYTSHSDWKQKADELNPLFIIYLGNSYGAEEVKAHKPDAMLYATHDAGQIFYRKAEMEEKKAEQHKVLKEIERLVGDARNKGEKEIEAMRHFSAMSFNDLYGMIRKGILSKDKDTHDKAWELLFGDGERHSNVIWMRMQFMVETWERSDGEGKEHLMCLSMQELIDEGIVRKLDDFTELDGQKYHQYMFCDFNGNDFNYIRRIPYGEKGQDSHVYQSLLANYDAPANFLRVKVEVVEAQRLKKEYLDVELPKVIRALREWKENQEKSMRELQVQPYDEGTEDEPMTFMEIGCLKRFLQRHDKAAFDELFPTVE